MAKVGHNRADCTQFTAFDHCPHLTYHRVSAVAVVYRANLTGGFGDFYDLFAFFNGHSHRLFTKNVKASLQERFGYLEVRVVWCRNGHEIKFILAAFFASQHFLPIAVCAVLGNAK